MQSLSRFIRQFKGGSIPVLAELSSGQLGVIKMKGAGNGAQSLAAEFIANRSAAALGFSVPQAFLISIPDAYPWVFGTDEFDDILRKSYGINLGLEYLGDCQPLGAAELLSLPPELKSQMACLDAFFLNYDRLAASGNIVKDGAGKTWLMDHGSCLFLDEALAGKPLALAPGHLLGEAGRGYLDEGMLRSLAGEALKHFRELPQPWLDEMGLKFEKIEALLNLRAGLI